MVTISCSGKLHAFALAEQMEKHGKLDTLFTSYASQKNSLLKRFVKRIDKEEIPARKIVTNSLLAFPIKLNQSKVHVWNNMFDKWVAGNLSRSKSKFFIGWSGMSLHAMRAAKKKGIKTILERGSTHIVFQDTILREEYHKFNINFSVHPAVIEKELKEYEEADYISVPSHFVKKTFVDKGIPATKILLNPYGAGKFFKADLQQQRTDKKFRVIYLGTLSIRKGLVYLFEALHQVNIPAEELEVWFIGSIEPALQATVDKFRKDNWKFWGHIDHYSLSQYLVQCDVAVQASLEEGLSMVIPQLMACGVPVIATPNSGGENIIKDEENGMVVPVRDADAIAKKIERLYQNRAQLSALKHAASSSIQQGFTWDDYGNRYVETLTSL